MSETRPIHAECRRCPTLCRDRHLDPHCLNWAFCPHNRKAHAAKAHEEIALAMHHIANAARPVLDLRLRAEFVRVERAMVALEAQINAIREAIREKEMGCRSH